MSAEGIGWLQAGGADCAAFECPPFGVSPEEWAEFCARRGLGAAGVGSKPSYHIDVGSKMNYNLFPQPTVEECDDGMFGVAGHRAPASFGLSRMLDFSPVDDGNFPRVTGVKYGKGWPNQDGLRKWWAQHKEEIVPGYCLAMAAIPCMHLNRGVQWCNICPVEGLVYNIKLLYQNVMLVEGVDGSAKDGGYVPIPPAQGFRKDKSEVVVIELVEVPPSNNDTCKPGCGHLEDWCVMVAADVFCGMTGK